MTAPLVIGSRGSRLALAQSEYIAGCLRDRNPGLTVRIDIISTMGDRILDSPLSRIGGKGVFTKEIEEALLDRRIDVAVHSLKDLPTELPEGLVVAAVPSREDPRDAFVSTKYTSLDTLPHGATVGTSSLRRAAQLRALRPDLNIVDLRGNIDTRLRKVAEGHLDAAILACAGLHRLGLDEAIRQTLPPQLMMSAPGQGALALEARADDARVRALLAELHDFAAEAETSAERGVLATLGGGCQAPLGALARVEEGQLTLLAWLGRVDGRQQIRVSDEGPVDQALAIAARATATLRARGADAILASVTAPTDQPLPLRDKRIVVTRAEAQAGALITPLREQGAEIIEFPTIQIEPADESIPIPSAQAFDWVLFTSANAVHFFAQRIAHEGRTMGEFSHAHIGAIGVATAAAVHDLGMSVKVLSDIAVAEGLVDALLASEPDLAGKRFLLPRGDSGRNVLSDELRARGAGVTEIVLYRTVLPDVPEGHADAIAAIVPDLVVFTSSSTVTNFCRILGPIRLERIKCRTTFAAIGPITAGTARELGLTISVQPATHDIPSLVESIAHWATAQK